MAEDIYCTLLMSDSYLPGAAVLAHSLRDSGTTKKLGVLVTPDTLLHSTIQELRKLYDYVISVERLANPNLENLARLDRLDLRFAFTKIALWRQEQFRKIVYIDADVVALRAPDELFDIEAPLAAAPDIGWPDIFNSGVMMLRPSMGEYWSLHTLASSGISFDGADQGLLNEHFGNRPWRRISFTYNCTPNPSYQYEPAYRHFRSGINMVHFIGKDKPWDIGRGPMTSSGSAVYRELYGKWWATYDRHYRLPQSSALGQVSLDPATVQRYVNDEQTHLAALSWASAGMPALGTREAQVVSPAPPPPPPEPTPEPHAATGVPGRVFSPPRNQWDATRGAPPAQSGPEAGNFPTSQYEMSQDTGLFHPPKYPDPPRDMYYKIPEIKPTFTEAPKPIFPWETSPHKRKATRVFEDTPRDEIPEAKDKVPSASPSSTPKIKAPELEWSQLMQSNAWDNISSIDQYVRSMKEVQARRGQVQVVHQQPVEGDLPADVSSPTGPAPPPFNARERRESLILTDFPTEIERPSLPVTPAPIRRPTFWGEERDEAGELPAASGVPEQSAWDPVARLEQLRRASLITAEELPKSPPDRDAPLREMPVSSVEGGGAVGQISGSEGVTERPAAVAVQAVEGLKAFDFGKGMSSSLPLSPSQDPFTGTGASTTTAATTTSTIAASSDPEDTTQLPPDQRPGGDEYSIA